ncbi:MAG: hypothetical protein AAFX04_00875 [Pseudomonadota bacterium]
MNARIRSVLLATAAAVTVTACGADDVASPGEGVIVLPAPTPAPPAPTPTPPTPTPPAGGTPPADCVAGTANVGLITLANGTEARNCQLSGVVTGNVVLEDRGNTIYSLSGRVDVGIDAGTDGTVPNPNGAVLTIEPGVVVFGSSGADFLLVNRGSQIFANGTANSPIIFTSASNVTGDAGVDTIGAWGGLVILGQAPISECSEGDPSNPADADGNFRTDCQAPIEGTTGAFYGGNDPSDNSGSLTFVQVRYPGFAISAGNELNGITLGAIGSGTRFENVQVHNSSDDGIEWFGGSVNGRNLALTGNDDDSIDTDVGYRGFLQYVLVAQRAGGGDQGWESDSETGQDILPRQFTQISNFTFVGNGGSGDFGVQKRGGADGSLFNGTIANFQTCIDFDEDETVRAADPTIQEAGPVRFESVFLTCATAFNDDSDVGADEADDSFLAGSNNTLNGTSTLTAIFINGANETAVTPFDVTAIDSFFQAVDFIGAVRDANDTRFQGWTCGLYDTDQPCTDLAISLNN